MEFTKLKDLAAAGGLQTIGVCSAEPFVDVAFNLVERKAAGLHGKLGFTYSGPEVSTDIRRTYPWAERLVVGLHLRDELGVAALRLDDGGDLRRVAV